MFSKHTSFTHSVAFVALVIIVGLFWHMADIVLMLFGGLLWAVLLNKTTVKLQKYVPWNYTVSLTAVFVSILAIFTIIGLLVAPQVTEQANEFVTEISQSWIQVQNYTAQFADNWIQFQQTFDWSKQLEEIPNILRKATSWITAAGGGLLSAVIVLYIGTLVAYDPEPYKKGILSVVPKEKKKLIQETLTELKNSLWRWLLGRFSSMLAVGILTFIGLLFLGMPLPFLLALLAGLLSFIPNIGIIIATSLAILLAFPLGWMMVLWVVLLYISVQFIEGNMITPFIEQHLMSLPAGLIIIGQIVFAYLFGFLGVMFATPLLVASIVLIQKLYIEDVLS